MSTQRIYALPVETTEWKFDGATDIQFNWEYDDGSDALLELYEKGKKQQWDASTRLDWSLELDPENPMQLKDEALSIHDTDYWRKMTDKEKGWLRQNLQANQISQFMHGEQGALIATAKIVGTVPDMNAKFYAATQVMDEARHVEAYKRLLHEKFDLAYPINPSLKTLLEQTLTRPALGHDLSRHAGADRGPGARRLPVDPRQGRQHAGGCGERLRHAGRGAARLVRPPGAARILSAAVGRRARRARAVRGRGALFHARPLQQLGSVGAARPAGRCAERAALQFQADGSRSAAACSAASCPRSRISACGASACRRPSPTWA